MLEVTGANGSNQWTVKSEWMIENRLAYLQIIGHFDATGMTEFNKHWVTEYLDKGIAPVHSIIDASQLEGYPTSLSTLREGSNMSVKHPNIGWIVMVGFSSNPVLKFLSSAVNQLFGVKFKQVETLEDAKDILRRVDTELAEIV